MGLPDPNYQGPPDGEGRGTLGRPTWLGGSLSRGQSSSPEGFMGRTQSLELPPVLSYLMQQNDSLQRQGAGLRSAMLPKYAMGGAVGPGGMPLPPPTYSAASAVQPRGAMALGAGQQQVPPQQLEAELQRFVSQHPEQVQQIKDEIAEELQEGGITAQQFNMAVQLATVAAQNPSMWPQIRNYIIQQELMEEDEIPQQYDQAFVFALMLAGRALGASGASAGVQSEGMAQAPQSSPIPTMASGGAVPNKNGKNKGVVIEAHEGEYVVPKHVVEMKGREFFDNLVIKYDPAQQGAKG